jgi:hypothetical protein
MSFNFFDVDLSAPGEALLKTGTFLFIGSFIDVLYNAHIPPILLETAKFCAYMGASVAFFKFLIEVYKKFKQPKK